MELAFLGYSELEFNDHVAHAAQAWSRGKSFTDVLGMSQLDEGDLVYSFRRAIDVLRQVRNARGKTPYWRRS